MFSLTSTSTTLLYIIIIVSTTFFAGKSQRISSKGVVPKVKWLIVAFFIHWFFCAFTNIGADHDQYIYIISYDARFRFLNGEEVGFNGLCMILYYLTHNAEICIFIIKTLTILLIYGGFYILRNHVQMYLCVLAYNVSIYFAGFYLLSISLALAFVFLSGALMIRNLHPNIAFLLAFVGMTVHTSCLLMVICFLGILILNKFSIKVGWALFALLLFMTIIILINIKGLVSYFISSVDLLSEYERYEEEKERSGSGLFYFFLYALFLFYMIPISKSNLNIHAKHTIIFYFLFSLIFSIMGYSFGISRIKYYSIVYTAIAIPYFFYQIKFEKLKLTSFLAPQTMILIWWIYLSFGFFQTIKFTREVWSTSHYELYNPFVV